jgi:hypothetical protein
MVAVNRGRAAVRCRRRGIALLPLLVTLVVAADAAARVVLDATLEPGQVVPTAPQANPQAGGLARFVLEDDGTVRWELRVYELTGFGSGTHLREAPPGAAGPVVVTLTNPPSSGTHVGTFGPLAPDAQSRLFEGLWYVQVETAANPAGEIRGQVRLASIDGRTCGCRGSTTKAFRKCVKTRIRELPRAVRKTPAASLVRGVARRAVCGPTRAGAGGRRVTCCLPWSPLENIVIEPLCARVRERACAALAGVPSAAPSCFADSNPCVTPR